MIDISISDARANLHRLLDEVAESRAPIRICGPRNNAILVSEEDWNAIEATVFLLSIPGMGQSIRDGLATPAQTMTAKLRW
jgi:antitoxin YefM